MTKPRRRSFELSSSRPSVDDSPGDPFTRVRNPPELSRDSSGVLALRSSSAALLWMINPRRKLAVDEFDPERGTAGVGASVPPLAGGSVGDNVVPVPTCDIPPEATVVGVVDAVTVARPDGANVPPEPAAREGPSVPPGVATEDANVVGAVVPADASEDAINVGNNVAPAIGEVVDPVTKVVLGDGAGEEPSSRGYVLFRVSTTIASVAIIRPSLRVMPLLPLTTSSAVTPQSEL